MSSFPSGISREDSLLFLSLHFPKIVHFCTSPRLDTAHACVVSLPRERGQDCDQSQRSQDGNELILKEVVHSYLKRTSGDYTGTVGKSLIRGTFRGDLTGVVVSVVTLIHNSIYLL